MSCHYSAQIHPNQMIQVTPKLRNKICLIAYLTHFIQCLSHNNRDFTSWSAVAILGVKQPEQSLCNITPDNQVSIHVLMYIIISITYRPDEERHGLVEDMGLVIPSQTKNERMQWTEARQIESYSCHPLHSSLIASLWTGNFQANLIRH